MRYHLGPGFLSILRLVDRVAERLHQSRRGCTRDRRVIDDEEPELLCGRGWRAGAVVAAHFRHDVPQMQQYADAPVLHRRGTGDERGSFEELPAPGLHSDLALIEQPVHDQGSSIISLSNHDRRWLVVPRPPI